MDNLEVLNGRILCGCKIIFRGKTCELDIEFCGAHSATLETVERMGRELDEETTALNEARRRIAKLETALKDCRLLALAVIKVLPEANCARETMRVADEALQ